MGEYLNWVCGVREIRLQSDGIAFTHPKSHIQNPNTKKNPNKNQILFLNDKTTSSLLHIPLRVRESTECIPKVCVIIRVNLAFSSLPLCGARERGPPNDTEREEDRENGREEEREEEREEGR